METIHCRSCGKEYLPGEANYCPRCGAILSEKINAADEILRVEKEPRPYEALRFTSGLIVSMGWLTIIIGWIGAFLSYTFSRAIAMALLNNSSPREIDNVATFIAMFIGIFNTLLGVSIIAYGQLLSLLVNMRDDLHLTTRLIRRFGLMLSDS